MLYRDPILAAQARFILWPILEIALKRSIGKLGIGAAGIVGHLDVHGFRRPDLCVKHLGAIDSLLWFQRDSFDRALGAQSGVGPMTLLTADHRLAAYGPMVQVT